MRWVKNVSSWQRRIWICLDVRVDIQRLIRQLNYLPDPSLVPHALRGIADTGFSSIILKHLLSGAFLEHLGPSTSNSLSPFITHPYYIPIPTHNGELASLITVTICFHWQPRVGATALSPERLRWRHEMEHTCTHSCQSFRGTVKKWCHLVVFWCWVLNK